MKSINYRQFEFQSCNSVTCRILSFCWTFYVFTQISCGYHQSKRKNEDISWYVRHKCTIVSTLWRRFNLLENMMCASGFFFFGCHIYFSPFARRTIYVNLSIMSPFAMTSLDYLKEEKKNRKWEKEKKNINVQFHVFAQLCICFHSTRNHKNVFFFYRRKQKYVENK